VNARKGIAQMVTNNYSDTIEDMVAVDSFRHDRYLIYRMLGREVSFLPQRSSKKFSGITERVFRNIFDNVVEITVSGRTFKFREPTLIAMHKDKIIFVYGNAVSAEPDDDMLFAEMQERFGETIDDVIRRMTPSKAKVLWFSIGKPVESRLWRRAS
jgi:hypothetical protein